MDTAKVVNLKRESVGTPTPMDRVILARHDRRPYTLDFIERIFDSFTEVHGDRKYRDDPAIITGWAELDGRPVAVVGHQKGRNVSERQMRNFGMPKPDGYRKALRLMKLAEKFNRPIFTFIDTPGAYPGIDAEERGQAEAIAVNLLEMSRLRVPVIVTVTGEGGSGGALAIGVGDVVLMLENAVYSVITPEGCAAILWKDASLSPKAAESLRLTALDLQTQKLIDEIVPEPEGGGQTDWDQTAATLKNCLLESLAKVERLPIEAMLSERYRKFRGMGVFR